MRFYEYGPARPVQGGIRSQSNLQGTGWWAKRWIAVLESLYLGGRLQRGRSYARAGQVRSLKISRQGVEAQVQGSRPQPYEVTIRLKRFDSRKWKEVTALVTADPLIRAKLLAGQLPPEIEALLPQKISDLETDCSCPDYSNPCKHLAAVHYLLAEELDRDPFLLFELRGGDREVLFPPDEGEVEATEPLALEGYWECLPLPAPPPMPALPTIAAPLLRQLGAFPMWRGQTRFLEAFEPVYRAASGFAMEQLGE